ncbi:peptidoglycan-binding domain-containing protein [Thiospirillum jenense]|uniref:Peptidoglycan-binding protein n=1 Tax=Thiospirillum jenense TaxID=1653858 RepID=A0A839HJP2_9GAMM|nr:peptidoglycan-binding domain-containing protein [Thiospirillum jenense]MBB1127008.1 peptidoglycan-binding protein [Thiospirillum jenense]
MQRRTTFLALALICAGAFTLPTADAAPINIHRAQMALQELGYRPGPADGVYGSNTRRAIKQFQRDHGLAVTGYFNEATVSRLRQISRRR